MKSALNILLVSKEAGTCSHFLSYLEEEGSQTTIACGAENAARLLLAGTALDAIVILNESIAAAGLVSSALKLISPLSPVILVTPEWPGNIVLPSSVDAVCYASSLGRAVASDIMRFVRCLLLERPQQQIDDPTYDDSRFVPHKPSYLN